MSSRVIMRAVEGWVDPERAYRELYSALDVSFWLDSGVEAISGWSYLGAPSVGGRTLDAAVRESTVHVSVVTDPGQAGVATRIAGTVFDMLRAEVAAPVRETAQPVRETTQPVRETGPDGAPGGNCGAGGPAFRLGWVGWLGYELGAQTQRTPVHPSRYPDARLVFIDRAIAFDHATRTVWLLALADEAEDSCEAETVEGWFAQTLTSLAALAEWPGTERRDEVASAPAPDSAPQHPEAHWRHDGPAYLGLVRQCQAFIADGEAYQICLTNEITVDTHPEPREAYARLRRLNPSHHGALLHFGDTSLLSSSPEQFLVVTPGGRMTTRPIKGTRPRGETPEADRLLRDELLTSAKERAENVMIVDLMRNDLGAVAETGSVRVPELFAVESYSSVHQLVSTVEAQLASGRSGVDAVISSFPAGSMTGAPKHRAMTILDRLEAGPRGLYAGAFGYFGVDGRIDLAMSIRSIVLDAHGATIGTGGGITSLSVPEEELAETRLKAEPLLRALGVPPTIIR